MYSMLFLLFFDKLDGVSVLHQLNNSIKFLAPNTSSHMDFKLNSSAVSIDMNMNQSFDITFRAKERLFFIFEDHESSLSEYRNFTFLLYGGSI